MPGILVVEDDENLNRGITFSLKKSGYEVFSAESVKKAKRIASDNNVDVTICDVNLPDGNGLEFVRWMRCNYNTYIICLTALDQEMDQVMGYEAGADDYITKPFSLSVLLLKIEAHFRRRQEKTEAGKMISGDIVFIAGEMKVLIKSREISLTKTELKMLIFFLQNPKQILSKTQILENVFDLEGDFVDENTIACPTTFPSTMIDRPKSPLLSATTSAANSTHAYPMSSSAPCNKQEIMPEANR